MLCYLLNFVFFKHKTVYEMRMSDWSSDVCSSDLDKDRKRFLWLSRMGTFRSAHFVFNFPTNLSHEGGLSVITCTLAWPSLDKRLRQADASSSDVTNTKASMPEGNDATAGTK